MYEIWPDERYAEFLDRLTALSLEFGVYIEGCEDEFRTDLELTTIEPATASTARLAVKLPEDEWGLSFEWNLREKRYE